MSDVQGALEEELGRRMAAFGEGHVEVSRWGGGGRPGLAAPCFSVWVGGVGWRVCVGGCVAGCVGGEGREGWAPHLPPNSPTYRIYLICSDPSVSDRPFKGNNDRLAGQLKLRMGLSCDLKPPLNRPTWLAFGWSPLGKPA